MLSTYPALEILEAHKLAVQTLRLSAKRDILSPEQLHKEWTPDIKPQFTAPESSGRLATVPIKKPATATFAAMGAK